jgi:LysM repeat protein
MAVASDPPPLRRNLRGTLPLELSERASYFRHMKRIFLLLVALAFCSAHGARAQDAATQERLDKLSGRIEDLTAAQEGLRKQISDLSKELASVREQSSKPNTSYARQEELNRLAEDIKAVDRKRMDDAEKIHSELLNLRKLLEKVLETPPPQPKRSAVTTPKETSAAGNSSTPEKGYEYVVKSGDTLSSIAAACKENNVKVTVAQILKANPGLKAERLREKQKIFIPATQP